MANRTCLAIVLAAGEGTRMRSALPKVLHAVAGRTLLAHVLMRWPGPARPAPRWWSGRTARTWRAKRNAALPQAETFVQTERRGTAHAVLAARGGARPRRPTTCW